MDRKTKADELAAVRDEWELLALLVRDRRERLGWDQEDLAQYGGPGKTTVGKIENARERRYSARTLQQIERALGWRRGTIQEDVLTLKPRDEHSLWEHADFRMDMYLNLIEEEAPDLLAGPTQTTGSVASAASLSDEELLAELTYRMKRYALEREGSGLGDNTAATKQAGESPATIVQVQPTEEELAEERTRGRLNSMHAAAVQLAIGRAPDLVEHDHPALAAAYADGWSSVTDRDLRAAINVARAMTDERFEDEEGALRRLRRDRRPSVSDLVPRRAPDVPDDIAASDHHADLGSAQAQRDRQDEETQG